MNYVMISYLESFIIVYYGGVLFKSTLMGTLVHCTQPNMNVKSDAAW